ncbi:MAG: phospho-sugar mutase, partial [Blastocatellia bacterium]|nr:phospho-sugar mutase [Blastocatellia bacterium]
MENRDLNNSNTWEETSRRLREEFSKVSTDESLIENALRLLGDWLNDPLYEPQRGAVMAHIESGKYSLLLDSFYQMIPFGTGGRRGRVGYGPNRINSATVEMSVQGHCNYLQEAFPRRGTKESSEIVVAFDTRVFRDISCTYGFLGHDHSLIGLTSRALAYQACEIYAGNGFIVNVPDIESPTRYLSTPELSFLIRHLRALGGINVSASHNHPDDNGFKFYNIEGAQDIPPTDEELISFMSDVREVKRCPFEEAVRQGLIRILSDELHRAYISINLKLQSKETDKATPIIYTPLSGTGDSTVGDVLRAAGYAVELYRPQADFDGTFSSIPFRLPNPEVPESASPALEEAEEKGAWMVLSTDPDADRIGVYARTARGEWRYLTGNDIALILAYYLVLDEERGPQRSGLIIKTLVTTRALEAVAAGGACKIIPDLLVGFKY